MKKTFTLLLGFILGFGATAQITIDSNDIGSIGDAVQIAFDDNVSGKMLDAATGSLQNFDYKGLKIEGTSVVAFMDPANTPNGVSFPAANIAVDLYGQSVAYGIKSANDMKVIGYFGDLLGLGAAIPISVNPGLTIAKFPTDYLDMYSEVVYIDTVVEDTFTGFFDSLRLKRTISTMSNVDAYGVLELPNLTENVLRRMDVEVTVDSVFGQIFGLWQPVLDQKDSVTNARFLAKGKDYYVLEAEVLPTGEIVSANFQLGAGLISGIIDFEDISCHGETDGNALVSGFSGTPPYSFAWSDANNTTTADVSGLGVGNYSVTVTDNVGATHVSSIVVTEPDSIMVTEDAIGPDYGTDDGFIDINVAGGTPGYSYLWSSGQNSKNLADLSAGTYTVTVTDSRGCEQTASFVVDNLNSVTNLSLVQNVNIYPNPSTGIVNISMDKDWELVIINSLGQTIVAREGFGTSTIDLSNEPSGLYFAKVKLNGNWYITKIQLMK